MPRSLDIQIVSHGTPELVETLLDDLARVPSRLFVLENLVAARAPERTGICVIRHPDAVPRGFAANHNRLAAEGQGELIAVLNPDLRIGRESWAGLLAAFDDPSVGIVAPRVRQPDGQVADNARRVLTPARLLRDRLWPQRRRTDYPDASRPCEPDWVAGMCLVVRRSLFERLGGFDARYRMYCEDMDLCIRSWLAGFAVRCLPCEGVVHDARRASLKDARHLRWHLASLGRFWRSDAYRRFRSNGRGPAAEPAGVGGRG
ncbi:MAG: glycosyltransferase [Rhodocyclaceae bacterium]|nr:glycosyltransferase [Rhodocyclaceae bacterium]